MACVKTSTPTFRAAWIGPVPRQADRDEHDPGDPVSAGACHVQYRRLPAERMAEQQHGSVAQAGPKSRDHGTDIGRDLGIAVPRGPGWPWRARPVPRRSATTTPGPRSTQCLGERRVVPRWCAHGRKDQHDGGVAIGRFGIDMKPEPLAAAIDEMLRVRGCRPGHADSLGAEVTGW